MRLFTLHELLRLPHAELTALHADVERQLAENLCDRQIALANLRLINRVLSLRESAIDRVGTLSVELGSTLRKGRG